MSDSLRESASSEAIHSNSYRLESLHESARESTFHFLNVAQYVQMSDLEPHPDALFVQDKAHFLSLLS